MTGPLLLNRQTSSTAGQSNVDLKARRSLRRTSSADSRQSMEPIPDEKQEKIKAKEIRPRLGTENDSGTEDLDQTVQHDADSPVQDHDDDAISTEFGACDDEGYDGQELPTPTRDAETDVIEKIRKDLAMAATIPHEDKKLFCPNTMHAFHGEFARRIAVPISLENPGVRYFLFADGELTGDACLWDGFSFVSLDNAKAQFQCPTCHRLWTSMRARIAFKVSVPQPNGFVVLKIFSQNCQGCGTPSDALWYMEEVCRVMENLAATMLNAFFPAMYDPSERGQVLPEFDRAPRRPRHDPNQRKGKMSAPHDSSQCEACQQGWCFPASL